MTYRASSFSSFFMVLALVLGLIFSIGCQKENASSQNRKWAGPAARKPQPSSHSNEKLSPGRYNLCKKEAVELCAQIDIDFKDETLAVRYQRTIYKSFGIGLELPLPSAAESTYSWNQTFRAEPKKTLVLFSSAKEKSPDIENQLRGLETPFLKFVDIDLIDQLDETLKGPRLVVLSSSLAIEQELLKHKSLNGLVVQKISLKKKDENGVDLMFNDLLKISGEKLPLHYILPFHFNEYDKDSLELKIDTNLLTSENYTLIEFVSPTGVRKSKIMLRSNAWPQKWPFQISLNLKRKPKRSALNR